MQSLGMVGGGEGGGWETCIQVKHLLAYGIVIAMHGGVEGSTETKVIGRRGT